MDNDFKIKKICASLYRKARLKLDYIGMDLKSEMDGNELIGQMLQFNTPFMVGRFGAVEMHCVYRWMNKQPYSTQERDQALYAAGIFPNDDETLGRFCEIYTQSMKQCDCLGVWEVTGEKKAVKMYAPTAKLVPSRSIEPYYHKHPWSAHLKGKKVLIVHPFVGTIKEQLKNSDKIWQQSDMLPKFKSVAFVKAVQSNAGAKPSQKDWIEALEYMKQEIAKQDFDVAIIGAGAYGFPLAAYVKSIGKQAIQMSGATQILFGIKGKRWDSHPVISNFYNEYWTRPSEKEKPPLIQKVEGGSYW